MRSHPIRFIAAATTMLVAVSALTACSPKTSSTDGFGNGLPTTIRIGYQILINGDLVMKNQKLLEKAFGPGVTIEWHLFDSGAAINQAIAGGSIDIGNMGSAPTSRGIASGLKYKVLWVTDVIGSNESLVVKPGINSVQDLRGKTIAVAFSSTSHYSLLAALKDAGVAASDVNIIDSDPTSTLAAWKTGKIDATYVWDPVLSEVIADGGTVLLTSSDMADKGHATYDLNVVTDDFAAKYPAAVQVWINQEAAAVQQLLTGDEKAYASIAAEAGITIDEAKKQTGGLVYVSTADQIGDGYLGKAVGEALFAQASFFHGLGQITTLPDQSVYQKAVVTTYASAVK